jgi:ribonuclease Z
MTKSILDAWSEDIDIRLNGLEPSVKEAYVIRPHEIQPGVIFRDSVATVSAFPVPHGSWKHAYGYRFDVGGKSIVISGDTTFSEKLMEAAKGCDILVHEHYSQKGWEGRTPDWRKYHAAFHTSAPDVGRIAARIQPKKLVLYHHLPMGQPPEQALAEIREHFKGEVIYGNDLDVIR